MSKPLAAPQHAWSRPVRRVNYDERPYDVYVKGRSLSPERMAVWVDAFNRYFPADRPLVIADVGSGTGRFTPVLADLFGGPVYGIEPSVKMRDQAAQHAAHPAVQYVEGRAEQLPLPDASCDGALAFLVWHHVEDKPKAAAELARVVRPGGVLVVRTGFSDRVRDLWWYRHLPGAREVDTEMYQPYDEVVGLFTGAGWRLTTSEVVNTPTTLGTDFRMLRLRSLSTFEHLADDEVELGLAAIAAAIDGREHEPVELPGDVLVFSRPGSAG